MPYVNTHTLRTSNDIWSSRLRDMRSKELSEDFDADFPRGESIENWIDSRVQGKYQNSNPYQDFLCASNQLKYDMTYPIYLRSTSDPNVDYYRRM